MKDYSKFSPSKKELAEYYAACCAVLACCGLLFYRNLAAALLLMTLAVPFKKVWIKTVLERRSEKLLEGFRDLLYSLSASVAAGRQLPEALEEARRSLLHSWGEGSDIYAEISAICREYCDSHADINLLLDDFAARSGVDEIRQFASACRICTKCGSSLEDVCFKSSAVLIEKISFKNELKALSAEKKLDIALLTAMPVAILLFLNVFSFGYIEPLYTCASGRVIMTCALGLIAAALLWSRKIMEVSI